VKLINKTYLKKCEKFECFEKAGFSSKKFLNFKYKKPIEYFIFFWDFYESFKSSFKKIKSETINNHFNGQAFAIIIAFLLEREKIKILKMDEELEDVKFVKPDFLVESNSKKKMFLSLKVSIRERWKQADWESMRFKKVYLESKTIVLMNHEQESKSLKEKLPDIDLDYVFYASSNDINELFKMIKS
jgi:hypothetical protein